MRRRSLAVVGDGPRLTYLMSALATLGSALHPLEITVYHQSDALGAGWVHHPGLSGRLHMNRLADDISFGPDPSCVGWESIAETPNTLAAWLSAQPGADRPVDGFPTRRSHGAALTEHALNESRRVRGVHDLRLVRCTVSSVRARAGGVTVRTTSGRARDHDEALLLVGHGLPSCGLPDFGSKTAEHQGAIEVVGSGATGLDMCLEHLEAGSDVVHRSRSGVRSWPRPTGAATLFAGAPHWLQVPDKNSTMTDVLAAIAAEIVRVHELSRGASASEATQRSSRVHSAVRRGPIASRQSLTATLVPTAEPTALREWHRFPWEVLGLLGVAPLAGEDHSPSDVRLREAVHGSPVVSAVEFVLRKQRPRITALSATVTSPRERSELFGILVGAMNRLVNGPAPVTLRTYADAERSGRLTFIHSATSATSTISVDAAVPPLTFASPGPLGGCLRDGIASVGVRYQLGGVEHLRVAVDSEMALTGPTSNGLVHAIGPAVDNGELLQASAARPGIDHPVFRDLTRWLDGLGRRCASHAHEGSLRDEGVCATKEPEDAR